MINKVNNKELKKQTPIIRNLQVRFKKGVFYESKRWLILL